MLHPEWPLLAFVVAVPTMVLASNAHSDHDASRLLQLATLMIGVVLHFIGAWARPQRLSRPGLMWSALLGTLAAASVAVSAMPAMALREVALTLGLVGIVAATANGLTDTNALHRFGLAALVGSALYAFLLCVLAITPMFAAHTLVWPNLAVGYDNYRFFNHVQTVALPLLALLAQDARLGRPARGAAWFAMAVYWAFVFCSGARGTALAIVIALAACVPLLGWRTVWPFARTLLLSVVAGAVAYAILFFVLPAWGGYPVLVAADRSIGSLTSDSARLLLWQVAKDQIATSPWLGIGPMHYAHYPNPKAAHPHNIYLQVAAEWGVPMLVALLALVGRGLLKLRRAIRSLMTGPAQNEGVALWVACVAVLLDAAVSGNFVMPVSQMWIAFGLAWAIAWTRLHAPQTYAARQEGRSALMQSRLVAGALVLSQIWLIAAVWDEAVDLDAHLTHVRETMGNAKTNPRFWSDGWF
jgi:O-antigen ligase